MDFVNLKEYVIKDRKMPLFDVLTKIVDCFLRISQCIFATTGCRKNAFQLSVQETCVLYCRSPGCAYLSGLTFSGSLFIQL